MEGAGRIIAEKEDKMDEILRSIGVLVKGTDGWRFAETEELLTLETEKRDCIQLVSKRLADAVFGRIGPDGQQTMYMLYAVENIQQVRDVLGGWVKE